MGLEIERKFLVKRLPDNLPPPITITQFYLSLDPKRTVRVRMAGRQAFLTIKGLRVGLAAPEFEYEIPITDVGSLETLRVSSIIRKNRYPIIIRDRVWEVDVFEAEHRGLIIAEIEMKKVMEKIRLPPWIGREVSFDPLYSNASLATPSQQTPPSS